MNTEAISVSLHELETAWTLKREAADAFTQIVEAVAGKAECEPSVLKAYISARMQDKVDVQAKRADQLNLLFGEIT